METYAKPGECRVIKFEEAQQMASNPYCCHTIGLSEVLQIAHKLYNNRLPPEVLIVGIQAEQMDRYEKKLSSPVEEAIPKALEIIIDLACR